MELCSIEDAFPNIDTPVLRGGKGSSGSGSGFPYVGGTDDRPSREERRAARKKAKKCKGPVAAFSESQVADLPDPDRPAVRRMLEVEAFQGAGSGASLSEDPEQPVPIALQKPKIPVLPKASCLFSDEGYPSHFGKGGSEGEGGYFGKSAEELEEGFAPFSGVGGDDPSYRLEPDFTRTFEFQGAQKAAGGALPAPNLDDSWKPMTAGASYTAFTSEPSGVMGGPAQGGRGDSSWASSLGEPQVVHGGSGVKAERVVPPEGRETLPPPPAPTIPIAPLEGTVPYGGNPAEDRDKLMGRIDALMGRLENLEKTRVQDTQKELLMFVGGGLALLVAFQLVGGR